MRRTSRLNSSSQTASTSGLLVDASLQEARRLAQTIAAVHPSQGMDPEQSRAFIERLARERTDLINLGVFDITGRPIAASTPGPQGREVRPQ